MDHKKTVYEYLRSLGEQVQKGKNLGSKDTLIVLSLLEVVLQDYNTKVTEPNYAQLSAITKW